MAWVKVVETGLTQEVAPNHWCLNPEFKAQYEVITLEDTLPEAEDDKPLESLNKEALLAKAKELGLAVPEGSTKAQIIALIEG
jgi:hypothetical protein